MDSNEFKLSKIVRYSGTVITVTFHIFITYALPFICWCHDEWFANVLSNLWYWSEISWLVCICFHALIISMFFTTYNRNMSYRGLGRSHIRIPTAHRNGLSKLSTIIDNYEVEINVRRYYYFCFQQCMKHTIPYFYPYIYRYISIYRLYFNLSDY